MKVRKTLEEVMPKMVVGLQKLVEKQRCDRRCYSSQSGDKTNTKWVVLRDKKTVRLIDS